MSEKYLELQNGSDIRGVACGGVREDRINLTADICTDIGYAFALWLTAKTGKKPEDTVIAVGRDSRITGRELIKGVMKGILCSGARVVDCGLASTPAMFMSLVYPETGYDGSCMITASHLPFNRNGLKFFDRDGGLEKADITKILQMAGEIDRKGKNPDMDVLPDLDLLSLYSKKLCEAIKAGVQAEDYDHPLAGLKIAVDAGNGSGGFFADDVLKVLGADTDGSRYLTPDGRFPNHIPNPENKEAMQSIVEATLASHADLGLIFDTDVDRMSAVLSDGTPLNRDAIIAMMAAILAPENPGSTIITDSVTSDRLTDFLEGTLGLKHLCYMRGYKNVINKCKELNASGINSPLAMETSGHGCLKENYYLDDGAYLAVKLLIALARAKKEGKELSHLIDGLSMKFTDREVRYRITAEDYRAYGAQVLETFRQRAKAAGYELPESYEGVRVRFRGEPTGWMLLRASLHDPQLVLNLEGTDEKNFEQIRNIAEELLQGFEGLD